VSEHHPLHKLLTAVFLLLLTGIFTLLSDLVQAQTKNGFDLSRASINPKQILSGGPDRDGIPAIDHPEFIPVKEVDYLRDKDIVIGLVRGNIAHAYPTRILIWHEIVNDVIANDAVAITYCPLCGTAMVFDRTIDGKTRTFGVSGLLYQSDVLMYDRESESLWSQLARQAVSGPAVGQKLNWLPSQYMTWKAWHRKYPDSLVLSLNTGYRRNYQAEAYASYFASDNTMFPVPYSRTELAKKAWVLGIIVNGKAKAYAIDDLSAKHRHGENVISDTINRTTLTVRYDAAKKSPHVTGPDGKTIPAVITFWFAWQAFYPDTQLWKPE